MLKKLFSFFAALTLSVGLWAISNVPYIDANGQLQYANNVTGVINSTDTLKEGWYVVMPGSSEKQTGTLVCQGEVHLIVCDGAKLTATGADNKPGIEVSGEGNSLTIYGYTNQSGQLIAIGGANAAGIGGGNAAAGSNITINGGVVTANGGQFGAGIGGGEGGSGENITINGGTVEATGGSGAAGIGGGDSGSGENITINGGTVEATGRSGAAGIGGGMISDGSDITINGGTVEATGGSGAAGIGGGAMGPGYNIYISDAYILKAGEAANPTDVIAHSSAQDIASSLYLYGKQYAKIEGLATPYTRTVTANQWGTVCLPYAVTDFSGVTFYKVNYYNASEEALYLEEVSDLEAGKPYIFEATADGTLTINHSATAPMAYSEAGNEGGLYGSLARKTIAFYTAHSYAAIANNAVNIVESGYSVTIPACRAYLDMNEVPTTEQPHSAPLRCMGVPRQQPTGNENVNVDGNMNGKFINNGRFVIIREGNVYNAQGQIIK